MHVWVVFFEPFFTLLGRAAEFTVLLATTGHQSVGQMARVVRIHPLCDSYLLLAEGCILRRRC